MRTVMPFGKHKGRAVADLPKGYLRWLLSGDCDLDHWLERAVREELDRRGERYADAVTVLADLEEVLTAAVSDDPKVGKKLAGRMTDHVMTTFEAVRGKYGIVAETELVIPARRAEADLALSVEK